MQNIKLTIHQDKSFAGSCLPETMNIASSYMSIISPQLDTKYKDWHFDDRVLVWLEPDLYQYIYKFYYQNGKQLTEIIFENQLEILDHKYRLDLIDKLQIKQSNSTEDDSLEKMELLKCPNCHSELEKLSIYVKYLEIELRKLKIELLQSIDRNDKKRVEDFYASKYGRYFHKNNCKWLLEVPKYNLIKFSCREDAYEIGLRACKTCRA